MFSMVAEQPAILLILILLIAPVLSAVAVLGYQDIQLISTPGNPASGYVRFFGSGSALGCLTSSGGNCLNFGSGSVTSVGFTGGLISVANPTTTPAFGCNKADCVR